MRFINALENARLTLKVLASAFIASFIINLLLMIGWYHAQSKVTIFLPPQIPQTGITLNSGEYPETMVYSFAYYVWQSINHWPTNGATDYKQNLEQFSPYLTPRFKSFLVRDYNERLNQGELQDRIRTLSGTNGVAFDRADVELQSNGVWVVHLKMRISEHMNANSNEVKNVDIDYTLRIVRYETDAKANPWGLALDGFVTEPARIQTYL